MIIVVVGEFFFNNNNLENFFPSSWSQAMGNPQKLIPAQRVEPRSLLR